MKQPVYGKLRVMCFRNILNHEWIVQILDNDSDFVEVGSFETRCAARVAVKMIKRTLDKVSRY